jgi:hypothetical protein
MTLITLQDGKLVLRDGKVGTGQACCCGCACAFREGSVIVVAVDGDDVEFFGPSGPIDASGDVDSVEVCVSSNTYLPNSYCESLLVSIRTVSVYVGCHDADWENLLPDPAPPNPENWPNSGMVVVVLKLWGSQSIYPECAGGDTGYRYFYYRMSCDDEGYPTTGELFHDSGAVEFDDTPYACFDCTNEPEINRDCENLSAPSSVSVVVNPLP